MGKKLRDRIPGTRKGGRTLARMNEDERTEMVELQHNWERLVLKTQAADAALTQFRMQMRDKYKLPRHFSIILGTGEITEPEEQPVMQEGVPQ